MNPEEVIAANKAIARRYYEEGVNLGNLAIIDELVARDAHNNDALPWDAVGREGSREACIKLRTAFPDVVRTIDLQAGEGDLVVTRWSDRGTHLGEFGGVAASGRAVHYSGITIHRIRDGAIIERWGVIDNLALLLQVAGKRGV